MNTFQKWAITLGVLGIFGVQLDAHVVTPIIDSYRLAHAVDQVKDEQHAAYCETLRDRPADHKRECEGNVR